MAKTLVLLAATCLLAGCGSLFKQPNPNKETFLLPPLGGAELGGEVATAPSSTSSSVLAVRPFRVVPEYADKGLTFRINDVRIERDYYHAWLVSPDAMITERTRSWLASSGLVGQVQDSGSLVTATHVLEGNILVFGGDFRGTDPKAVVVMRLTVLPFKGAAAGATILHETYRAEIPLQNRDSGTLVAGLGAGLAQVYNQFGADLNRVLP